MASKDKNTLPKFQTTTSTKDETIVPLPSDGGLAGIATSATASDAGKRMDVVQKAQVSPDAVKGKSKESPPGNTFRNVYRKWDSSTTYSTRYKKKVAYRETQRT